MDPNVEKLQLLADSEPDSHANIQAGAHADMQADVQAGEQAGEQPDVQAGEQPNDQEDFCITKEVRWVGYNVQTFNLSPSNVVTPINSNSKEDHIKIDEGQVERLMKRTLPDQQCNHKGGNSHQVKNITAEEKTMMGQMVHIITDLVEMMRQLYVGGLQEPQSSSSAGNGGQCDYVYLNPHTGEEVKSEILQRLDNTGDESAQYRKVRVEESMRHSIISL